MPEPTHTELAARLCTAESGISIAVADGSEPVDGYMVSLDGSGLRIDSEVWSNGRSAYALILAWVRTVQPASHHRHIGLFVGRWTDRHGRIYLDLSVRCETREAAYRWLRANPQQQAAYDVAAGETLGYRRLARLLGHPYHVNDPAANRENT